MEEEIEKITEIISQQNKMIYKLTQTVVEQNNRICFLASEISKLKRGK